MRSFRNFPMLTNALRILEYLYNEEKRDYLESDFTKLIPSDYVFDSSSDTGRRLIDLHTRFIARMTSYIVTAISLEKQIEEIFKIANNYSTVSKNEYLDKILKKKKLEVENHYKWRDKMFAHLEQLERDRDTTDEIKRIVRYFYSGLFIQCHPSGEYLTLNPKDSNPSHDFFDEINIVGQHLQLISHYENWGEIFSDYRIDDMHLNLIY